ncbi:MAG: hypothetical protein II724_01105, partial [Clostridia bacterium]|nr:hypothetical protein [Clostridia bacterium]
MKTAKRFYALLLAVLMTVSLLPVSSLAKEISVPMRGETIVGWNFDESTNSATTANANNTGAVVLRENSDITFSYVSGNGSAKALSSTNWDSASETNPKYYAAAVNASGYENLTVSAAFYCSGTGPKNIALYYSVDGENFIAVDNASVALAAKTWDTVEGTLPEAANGAESLEIRFVVNDTVSAGNGTTASGGTCRVDDIIVAGTPAGEEPDPTEDPGNTEDPVVTEEPTAEPTEDPYNNVTIAEAIAAADGIEGICVIGTVTFIDGKNVYVQDETAGINLFLNANASGVAIGDSVMAVGKRATYKGLPELSGIDGTNAEQFAVLSSGNPLPLEEVTIEALLANTADYMCERIIVKNAVLGAVNTNGNTPITQGESSINIYKIPAVTAAENDNVNVTAIVSYYNSVQLRVASAEDVEVIVPLVDPIDPGDYPDYSTIADVLAMTQTGGTATVVGQVTMKFGNFGSLNSVALGDVEDNEIIGLQIYDYTNIASYVVGNIVAVTGTVGDYGGVRQLSNVTAVTVLDAEKEPMAAQEVTLAELTANIADYLSEFVVIKDAVLGAYASSGSTFITDAEGTTMPIYRAAAYPEGVSEGDTVDVYAVASRYNATVQLRNGASADYVVTNVSYIDIADALALENGASATVRGVVTFIDGRNVYVQDDTGAIVLYLTAESETLAVGDLVEATGTRGDYKGLPELTGIDPANEEQIKVVSNGNNLPVEAVTIAQLIAEPDAYMCERIRLEGVTIGAINTSNNTPITQDEASINIYRIPETEFTEGDLVDIIAIVSCYNNVQLRVAAAADIYEHVVFNDPIPDDLFTEDDMTIPEVIAAADQAEVTLIAQLVYRFGNYDSVNSAILEDIIDGEICGLQMYNSLDDYEIGDILRISATKTTYGGVPQIQSATTVTKLGHEDRIPAQPFNTFAELNANRENLLSEYVMVRGVTLGAYNDNGNTYVTDSTGATMPIYRAASYSSFCVEAGEVVDLCAALSKYSSTWQFRGGEYFGENKAPVITLGSFLDAQVGVDYDAAITVTDDYGIASVVMQYACGEVTGEVEMTFNTASSKYKGTVPGSAITAGNAVLDLTFVATDTSGLVGNATAAVTIVDEPQIVSVQPAPNSATHEDKAPEISVTFANAGEAPEVVITVAGVEGETVVEGETASFVYDGELEDGKYTASVTVTRADGVSATYSWSFTVGEPTYGFYFGQLHSHTAEYSDGAGTIEDAFSYVTGLAESENVDFVALTDHSNYFDNKTNLGDFENVESGIIADNGHSKWYNYTTTIDSFNTRQSDVIFIGGYE